MISAAAARKWGFSGVRRRRISHGLVVTSRLDTRGPSRSSAIRCPALVFAFRSNAQALVHERARRRVLQVNLFAWLEVFLDRKCSKCGLVKARQDQLLLTGISIDITNRINARYVGLEFFGVDAQLFLVDLQAPLCNRAKLRMQAEEHE